jgi:hypothetical protein
VAGRDVPQERLITGLLAAGALASLLLLRAPGTEDVEMWRLWMSQLAEHGLVEGFARSGGIYPPGTFVWLFAVIKSASLLGIGHFLALKLSLTLALALTAAVLWAWTRDLSLALACFLSLALNAVALGYTDAHFAPPLMLSLYALARGFTATSGALLAASFLVKWQPLILAPFFVVWLAADGDRAFWPALRRVLRFVAGCASVVALAFAGFGATLLLTLRDALTHNYLSGNALNVNWIYTWLLHVLRPETFGPLTSGPAALRSEALLIATADPLLILPQRLLFAGCYVYCLARLARPGARFSDFVQASAFGFLAYCMLATGVHENHFFAALLLLALLAGLERARWPLFLAWAVAANLNLWTFYGLRGRPPRIDFIVALTVFFATCNVLLFAISFVAAMRRRS